MGNSHKSSELSLYKQLIPVDSYTSFLAHFDITENDVLRGVEPISNVSTMRNFEGKYGGGIAVEEGTTNLIPDVKNMYPTYGNAHRTYNTNQYNSNTDFSIGVVTSVVDNIITLSPVDRVINTYDVLNPATTGGGVIAGTNYFIKKHSANSFSIHEYDNTPDGSKGFGVHDSVNNDIRVVVSATDFPTMWHGSPHLPNSGLVKEIIPDGFSNNGVVHDCIRLHTEHRLADGGGTDHMAYGVYPSVVAGTTYTFSFYYRASTPETIGMAVSLGLYTAGGWVGDYVSKTITSMDWERYEMTVTAPNTGGTNMYFSQSRGSTIDIAEIQCEQKTFATSFIDSTRSNGILDYGDISQFIPKDQHTVMMWVNGGSGSFGLSQSWNMAFSISPAFYLGWDNPTAYRISYCDSNRTQQTLTYAGKSFAPDTWYMVGYTFDNGIVKLFLDGKKVAESTTSTTLDYNRNDNETRNLFIGNYYGSSNYQFNGIIDEVRIDKISRTEEEIESWYISQLPFYPKGIYRLAY